MDLFPSNSTHISWGMWSIVLVVPWELHSLMEISPVIGQWEYINVPYLMDSSGVRLQEHLFTPVRMYQVYWGPFSLLVGSLTFINSLHQLSVIKWFPPCSNSTHLFKWMDSSFSMVWEEYLGKTVAFMSFFLLLNLCKTVPRLS